MMAFGATWLSQVARAAFERNMAPPPGEERYPGSTWEELKDWQQQGWRQHVIDMTEAINDVDETAFRVLYRLSQDTP